MRIITEEDIAIEAIPLAIKPSVIIEYKIVKEGKISTYHITRADESTRRYTLMINLLENIDKEYLETLWKTVKDKYGNIRLEERYERVLWGDLKVMFELNIESEVWRQLQGHEVSVWKFFSSCGVRFVRFKNLHIFILVDKVYPLTPATIKMMLERKQQANQWNEVCYQLLKLMMNANFSHCWEKLSTVSVFLSFGLTFAGTFKYWGVLRMLMIGLRLIPLGEFNSDFHLMVDFMAASPLRYALTVKPTIFVSHIRQFWSTTRIETMDEGTHILTTMDDEHASPMRDVSEGEACPTESSFITDHDRETIAKSFTLPYDSAPRVTSPAADEGSMQQTISELTALCTSLQRQHFELLAKFQAQEEDIVRLKERVQVLEDRESVAAKQSGDDAPIKRRSINEGEAVAKRIRGIDVPTGSGSIPTAGPPATVISTGSKIGPIASPIVTSYSRRKGKEVIVKSDTPKKQRLQEQIDAQVEDFIPIGSKEEAERLKRKGLNLEQEHVKKQKSSEEALEIEKSTEEITEEKMKEMMQLVLVEDVYV
uniref:Uncharacterized protein n=1 Tax=Tanacetum cinerariifolium TaxID=118510 RepID=A0A699I970_TANCI|nr:hypothetical protein [Tanacetum cinerariifolium]